MQHCFGENFGSIILDGTHRHVFSPQQTTHYAAQIANWFHASLCIAQVFLPARWSEFGREDAYNLIDRQRLELRARLDQLSEQAQRIVPECASVCLEGEPAEQRKGQKGQVNSSAAA